MTLYRNLGPINFQSQTDSLQIFSNQNKTLIMQFKNSEALDFDELSKIISLYSLILKKQDLLQIYQEKGKPFSILVHQAVRVGFEKINIDLLCRIIKQLVTSMLHCTQISKGGYGQLNEDLFLQIDGELRYLYFPTLTDKNMEQNFVQLFSNLLQFIHKFKNEKEVSHRLLLKKIMKCQSLQQIIQETDYFLNVYTVKQTSKAFLNSCLSQPLFISKSKVIGNNHVSHNPYNGNITKGSNGPRRKYQIFKKQDIKPFNQTYDYQSTWRKINQQKNQSFYNSARTSFRNNSQAVHLDLKSRNYSNKHQTNSNTNSIFKRATSMSNSQKISERKTTKKKSSNFAHSKMRSAHIQPNFNSFMKNSRKSKAKQYSETIHQSINLNQSVVSKKLQSSGNLNQNRETSKLKNMVHKSLQKWKNKQSQKQNFYHKIKQNFNKIQAKEESTHIQSSRKFQNLHHISKQSVLFQQKGSQNIPLQSEIKTKNTKVLQQQEEQNNKKQAKNNQFQVKEQNKTQVKKNYKNQKKTTSLQEINFSKKPQIINNQTPIVTSKNQRISGLTQHPFNKRANNSDQSQTQRIQYSKKSIKKQPTLIQQFQDRKRQIQLIATCVVDTPKYLSKFQTIFWQLPMFYLYKKFYQLRIKLSQMLKGKNSVQELQMKKKIDSQNQDIQESLVKLLKIVKKKVKKNYERLQEIHQIQKGLHLDYTMKYDHHIRQYSKIYLISLLEATPQFPELIMHDIQIMDSILICFGKQINMDRRNQIIQDQKQMTKYYDERLKMMEGLIFNNSHKKLK